MKRLRVLLPGCPFEVALDQRLAATEQMRADLAEMVETATAMTIGKVPPSCERRSQCLPVMRERRRATR